MSALTGISQTSALTQTTADTTSGLGETIPEDPPQPSESAVDFLQMIEADDFKHVLFEDRLVTVSDAGKELGEFTVTIEPAKFKGEECLLVHANSHGAIDSVPCGTSITAYVSHKLETLEQNHHEYVKLENHPLDRKTFIVRQDDNYVINRVITQGEDVQRASKTLKLSTMTGFVSEGSNLLLQRLLIKKGLPDDFQMVSLDSDTNLCPVIYKSLEARTQIVQQTDLDVKGIERTINSISDLPTTWQSYFTKEGQLTSRVQVGSPVMMRLIVAPLQVEDVEEPPKPTFGKQSLNFEDDIQMYSKFLDRKEELKNDHGVYMHQHPELKALMGDFMQFLLLRKPDDVLAFAADFFSSFSSKMPGQSPYAESSSPSPFPNSRSNSKIQHLAQSR